MPDQSHISKEKNFMPGCKAAKDKLTLLFVGNISGNMKVKPLLPYHVENQRALKSLVKDTLLVVGRVTLRPGLHRLFSKTVFFPPLYPGSKEIMLGEFCPIECSFTAH